MYIHKYYRLPFHMAKEIHMEFVFEFIHKVPGRLYPIKVHYRPVSVEELTTRTGKLNPAPYVRVLQLIDDKFPR